MKRMFDTTVSMILLILAAPIIAGIIIALRWQRNGPVFYVAERMKTPDQSFNLLKFRTMQDSGGQENGGVTGGDKTHRITAVGRKLRRYRLDELPQLINVLRGDMSLVGPRPPLRQYTQKFPDLYARVLRSPPGVTGLATLHYHRHEGRLLATTATPQQTDATYVQRCIPRKARIDLIYQRHASLCFDVAILWQTARRVLTR